MTDQNGKPPLSNPMAEALAEDAAARAVEASAVETPQPAVKAAPETEDAVEAALSSKAPAPDQAATDDAKKPRKTTEDVLKGRVGYLTKRANEAERAAAERAREIETMRALLAAQGQTAPESAAAPAAPQRGSAPRTYTQAEVQAEAARIAAINAFNERANTAYESGKEKFGDWDSRLDNLRATGLMSEALIDAAISSDAPTDVLHHLGGDLAEAERIANLPPVRMGMELAKLAGKLSAPKSRPISSAPAPISPVNGSASPVVDFTKLAEGDDMKAWVAARAKAGDRWATGRQR